MSTIDKALSLLDLFSESRPESGLSELARLAGYDKATTRRFLVALTNNGYLEQDTVSKKYRLGPALLRLARVREATFPISDLVQPVINDLRDQTGETAHFSLVAGTSMATMLTAESLRANRVSLENGERLPLHCTASGIAWLAHAPVPMVKRLLSRPLKAETAHTITDPEQLKTMIECARTSGVAVAEQSYENDVQGIAAAVFDETGRANGTIAVATPLSRVTPESTAMVKNAVLEASCEITRRQGGTPRKPLLTSGA